MRCGKPNPDREVMEKVDYEPPSLLRIDIEAPTSEQQTVETIRAKVSELNAAIAEAVEFGIKVEIDTLDHYRSDRPGCPATTLLATISKVL